SPFWFRHDRTDRVERRHDAERPIIVQAEVAILWPRIPPGNYKNREPLLDEVLHQRVLRRKIKNIVFHDPCRNVTKKYIPSDIALAGQCCRSLLPQWRATAMIV